MGIHNQPISRFALGDGVTNGPSVNRRARGTEGARNQRRNLRRWEPRWDGVQLPYNDLLGTGVVVFLPNREQFGLGLTMRNTTDTQGLAIAPPVREGLI